MKRAVLFDLDGTLVDSTAVHAAGFDSALRKWWKPCDVPLRTDLTTKQKMEMLGVPEELREDIQRDTRAWTLELIPQMIHPDQRLAAELLDLHPDFILGVVTNARRDPAEAMLKAMGIRLLIDVLVTSEDGKHKPEPDLYLVAKSRVPRAAGFLAIEDSETGALAANRAGIWVLRAAGPQDITAKRVRDFLGYS